MSTIEAIRARWEAAAPAPWHNDNGGEEGVIRVWFGRDPEAAGLPSTHDLTVACVLFPGDMETYEGPDFRTAEASASAPADVRDLLSEVDRLRAALALVAARDGGGLFWKDGCACDACEANREVARLLGIGRTWDGALPGEAVRP